MLKEKITVIKNKLKFSELPVVLQESLIHGMADDLLSRNKSETDLTLHHDRDSAYAMAKLYYTEWSDYKKYVHYNSSIYGWRVCEEGKEI